MPNLILASVLSSALVSSALTLTATPAHAAPRTVTAAAAPSLSGWKLTLPVSADGSAGGKAKVVDPAKLTKPYLTSSGGSLVFWAPSKGATTPNSSSPRTELVRKSGFTSGSHKLSATVTVNQVPSGSKEIIFGQIHGNGSLNSKPYVLLYFGNGKVHAKVNQQQDAGSDYKDYPLTTVEVGQSFDWSIASSGKTLTFTADSVEKTAPIPSVWAGKDVRFQTGDYLKIKGSPSSDDGGKITFSSLSAS